MAVAAALVAGCGEDPCDYALCPIDDPECVMAISEAIACRRGGEVLVPEIRFASRDELLAEWQAEDGEPTAQEQQDARDSLAADALLGLMPAGYEPGMATADSLANVIGLYDDGEVIIVSDGGTAGPIGEYVLMVHELTHFYQDTESGLDEVRQQHATTFDRFFGVRAAIEGEADLFETLARAYLTDVHPSDASWRELIASSQVSALDAASRTPLPSIHALQLFPYAFGLGWDYDAWQVDGADAMRAQVADPPASVREVMEGYERRDRHPNGDARLDPHAAPVLPGFSPVGGGHQGAWLLNAMLQRTSGTNTLWFPELEHVDADFLAKLRRTGGQEVVAVWRIQTGQPDALLQTLTESAQSLWSTDPSHAARRVDDDIVLLATTGADADALLQQIEGWTHPDAAFVSPPRRLPPAMACARLD